jgi:hypothetical protein
MLTGIVGQRFRLGAVMLFEQHPECPTMTALRAQIAQTMS